MSYLPRFLQTLQTKVILFSGNMIGASSICFATSRANSPGKFFNEGEVGISSKGVLVNA